MRVYDKIGLLGVMVGTSGCKNIDENSIPVVKSLSKTYNLFNRYVQDVVRDFEIKSTAITLILDDVLM